MSAPSSVASAQGAVRPRSMAAATPHHRSAFRELLAELNPLQYIPVIGTIYRAVTGDTIPETARTVGSFVVSGLEGGPVGLAMNAAMLGIEKLFHIDPEKIGQRLLADLGIGHAPAASSPAFPSAPATLAAQGLATPAPLHATAWSSAQLSAYGVRTEAGGLSRGALRGSDVLNDLELARLQAPEMMLARAGFQTQA